MNFKNYLKEEQVEETALGVIKYRTLKALNYMKENLTNTNVKRVLEGLDCPNCKNKGNHKKLVDGLIEMVEGSQTNNPILKQLFRNIRRFSFND